MGNTVSSFSFSSSTDLGFKELLANCVVYGKHATETEIKRIERNVKSLSGEREMF